MYSKELDSINNAAKSKVQLMENNITGYFTSSMLAGMYVGFGIILIFTIGGLLDGSPFTKLIMGVSFGIALSLVMICGADLFTGNNMVMTIGAIKKGITWKQGVKLWVVCHLGNWVGSIILAILFYYTGLLSGKVGDFIMNGALAKMSLTPIELITRAILCNILVCLAVWACYRCNSESGKLIMIFWCLFAFITTGFEHSVANMTLLTMGVIKKVGLDGNFASLFGYFYNIILVTFGNMIGGIVFVALPYLKIKK